MSSLSLQWLTLHISNAGHILVMHSFLLDLFSFLWLLMLDLLCNVIQSNIFQQVHQFLDSIDLSLKEEPVVPFIHNFSPGIW